MTKNEKYAVLIEYYNACRHEIIGRHLLMELVLRIYQGRMDGCDAQELTGKMEDLNILAVNDIACSKWTTENALRKMFERDCIDDDEESDEP